MALSAAHAYAMVTGEAQAVVVHVDSGAQNVGGMVNNAMRGRAPVLVFTGTAPYTQGGELPGSRTEFIQWIQDVRDQRGILRKVLHPPGAPGRGSGGNRRVPGVARADGGPARGSAAGGRGLRRNHDRPGRTAPDLKDALATVQAGRSAVVSVRLPPV